jgi:hypothetical protein
VRSALGAQIDDAHDGGVTQAPPGGREGLPMDGAFSDDVPRRGWMASRLVTCGLAMTLLAGCGGAGSPSGEPSASGRDFALEVAPAISVGQTVQDQRVVFLVTISGSEADGPAEIAADAGGATVQIEPQPLAPAVVGEVAIIPGPVSRETSLAVTITATRGSVAKEAVRTLTLAPGEDTIKAEAEHHLATFVAWLASKHPELGIDSSTAWDGTVGSWVLVVNHYLFFSEDWELGLQWHVMIAPDDWAQIYLRRRWTETKPSLAFEISSVSGGTEPREMAVPEDVWR